MGLAWLPLEKVPVFIWGLLLSLIGGFLVVHEDPLTWAQGKALLLLVVGICAFIYDIRNRHLKSIQGKIKIGSPDEKANPMR
jgi:uncharacterized membrane protein YccC